MSKLAINNLSMSYGQKNIFTKLTCEIAKGQFTVLLGPSGCGKSTFLRLITGNEVCQKGNISFDGVDLKNIPIYHRSVAMVSQQFGLFLHLNARKNIFLGAKKNPKIIEMCEKNGFNKIGMRVPFPSGIKSAIDEIIDSAANLSDTRDFLHVQTAKLSGGQQQRIAIARALAQDAEIILFDEPLTGLDPHLRAGVRNNILALHKKTQKTFLWTTHTPADAEALADEVFVFSETGEILQSGSFESIYNFPKNDLVKNLIGKN